MTIWEILIGAPATLLFEKNLFLNTAFAAVIFCRFLFYKPPIFTYNNVLRRVGREAYGSGLLIHGRLKNVAQVRILYPPFVLY